MKPWKEIAIPHRDVLEGTFQQAEFAADITAVRSGKAPREYQDPVFFYERTFITQGMRLLLTQVAQRLSGGGGEPVIQLQTAFGGGKTHTMLAVYHLASRSCPLADLQGLPTLIEQAGLMDIPQARVAVLDGTAHSPGQPWKYGTQQINTLWGELAWQLGGSEGYNLLAEADQTGTSPGKEVLRNLLAHHAPCVVLIDELVAYVRQFRGSESLSGGTYDSNISFVQALTEAAKLVPNSALLASLPESELEAGSQSGVAALRALEHIFGRVQAIWKPVATEEAFEIVRRRLFEPVRETSTRDAVCRAFADLYVAEGAKLPAETQEARYYDRLVQAYPIHPEVFDRLYEDWTTIEGFQRTRGVLKLMAKVIFKLWKDDNKDLIILPGSIPLYDGSTRNELTYYLPAGWDPVIDRDIDGDRAETTELESKEPRFGQVNAARRVGRTVFFGTAPASVIVRSGMRGMDRSRILLGCLQPGQPTSIFTDALSRLADLLHYLNSSGDKNDGATRFWFDTRANLRREMGDRRGRFDEPQVRSKLADALKQVFGPASLFDGVHIFTPHSDVPDDAALRLVVLPTDKWYSRDEARQSAEAVLEAVRTNGTRPRHRRNRLMFLAADQTSASRLIDSARTALAWRSIVQDVNENRLNIDLIQKRQAEQELQANEGVLLRTAREAYCWLLCPYQETASDQPVVEAYKISTSGGSAGTEIDRVCTENELIISAWSPTHLRAKLKELYWKPDEPHVSAKAFWEDTLRYVYLPRLKNIEVLTKTVRAGAASDDFFGTAYGHVDGRYEGFHFGEGDVQVDDTLLLIEADAARAYRDYEIGNSSAATERGVDSDERGDQAAGGIGQPDHGDHTSPPPPPPPPPPPAGPNAFHASADVPAAIAKMRFMQLAEEIVSLLTREPNADVRVTVEISATFPEGASEHVKRSVSENATALGLRSAEWEAS